MFAPPVRPYVKRNNVPTQRSIASIGLMDFSAATSVGARSRAKRVKNSFILVHATSRQRHRSIQHEYAFRRSEHVKCLHDKAHASQRKIFPFIPHGLHAWRRILQNAKLPTWLALSQHVERRN